MIQHTPRTIKLHQFKSQLRDRQISQYKQAIRRGNSYIVVNYSDSPSTILNLKRALFYCPDFEQEVIHLTGELMNRHDFCEQISAQRLLETILIAIQARKHQNTFQKQSLIASWLSLIDRTIRQWPYIWPQLHQNIPRLLWALALDSRNCKNTVTQVLSLLCLLYQNLNINVQPSAAQVELLINQQIRVPEIMNLLALGFNPIRQFRSSYYQAIFSSGTYTPSSPINLAGLF